MPRSVRLLALMCSMSVAACQCLVPVSDLPDSGKHAKDGGTGGGSGGGAGGVGGTGGSGGTGGTGGGIAITDGGHCTAPTDCIGDAGPVVGFCSGQAARWSCAMGHCVSECGVSRLCDWDGGQRCTTCDGTTDCPETAVCPSMTHLFIESATAGCAQLANTSLAATSFSSSACSWGLRFADGGTAGLVVFYQYNAVSADLPFLGGGCVGEQLPTGAIRFGLSCPACMLSVRPIVVGP